VGLEKFGLKARNKPLLPVWRWHGRQRGEQMDETLFEQLTPEQQAAELRRAQQEDEESQDM
jgi:hypothetical protein